MRITYNFSYLFAIFAEEAWSKGNLKVLGKLAGNPDFARYGFTD
jgi:hypothetical protein